MTADRVDEQLRRISEALDGEGPLPDELGPEAEAFLATARNVRSMLRVEEAEVPPDLTDAVLARVRTEPRRTGAAPRAIAQRPLLRSAAAVFLVAALVAAWAVRPGGPLHTDPAAADVGVEVLQAQRSVSQLDATVRLTERGAHPDVPLRRYEGTLRYRAPEQLRLQLAERSAPPPGWPRNDLELVVDDGTAWASGLRACPVADQPGCLGARAGRAMVGLAPFAHDWISPLELVVPVDAFLPQVATHGMHGDGTVMVETTTARLHRVLESLQSSGALRSVHTTDRVRLELDAEAFTIRRLTVLASDTTARQLWAATNGYHDEPGDTLLDLEITAASLPAVGVQPVPARARDAGFEDRSEVDGPTPGWLPHGFAPHRSGVLADAGPPTVVRSWSDGRAWIRLDATAEWRGDELFGNLGPLVRPVALGGGIAYTNAGGSVVAVRGEGVDLAVTGSVPLATLLRVAESLDVVGRAVPADWAQAEVLTALPKGALRPSGPLTARYQGPDLLVAAPGPGDTGAVLVQRPGTLLDPPAKADVVETTVRGLPGRYAPRLGTLTWVEDGWQRELRGPGLDLADLLAVAEELEAA